MSPARKTKHITLAVHPDRRGFGWVAFEGPFAVHDWGLAVGRPNKNAACLRRIEALLTRLSPETLVLESFERPGSRRADRITRLCRAIAALAADRGTDVAVYSRKDVVACFGDVGARTRQEIAEAVVRHVDAFRHQLPKPRRRWDDEDRRMALFSAAAIALTHYRLGAATLFEDLKDVA